MAGLLKHTSQSRRSRERLAADVTVMVRRTDGAKVLCRIADVSTEGARLNGLPALLARGDEVSVEMIGGARGQSNLGTAEVVWVRSRKRAQVRPRRCRQDGAPQRRGAGRGREERYRRDRARRGLRLPARRGTGRAGAARLRVPQGRGAVTAITARLRRTLEAPPHARTGMTTSLSAGSHRPTKL
jgi:hypothetical protein